MGNGAVAGVQQFGRKLFNRSSLRDPHGSAPVAPPCKHATNTLEGRSRRALLQSPDA